MIGNKLSVDVVALRAALNFTSKTTERRNTIPVLAMTLFEVCDGKLHITTTDLDQWTTETIECDAEGSWSFVGQAGVLLRLMKGLAGLATFEMIDIKNTLGLSFEIDGTVYRESFLCDAEEFPQPETKGAREAFEVNEGAMLAGLRHTTPCISTEETRYYLNGVYFERQEDGQARLVATDGHRMGIFGLDASLKKKNLPTGGIIPRKAISSLVNMVRKDGNRSLSIQFFGESVGADKVVETENFICLRLGERKLTTKLIHGTYPDYRRVMPSDADKIDVTVNREAVRRVMAIHPKTRQPIRISPSDSSITMKSVDAGEIRVPITANSRDGADIGFGGLYLKEMTEVHETLRITGLSPSDPARVTPDDPRALYVLMPMRL